MNFIDKALLSMVTIMTTPLEAIQNQKIFFDRTIGGIFGGVKDAVKAKKMEPYVQTGMYLIGGLIIAILLLAVVLIFKRRK